jgi:hypothetical protein
VGEGSGCNIKGLSDKRRNILSHVTPTVGGVLGTSYNLGLGRASHTHINDTNTLHSRIVPAISPAMGCCARCLVRILHWREGGQPFGHSTVWYTTDTSLLVPRLKEAKEQPGCWAACFHLVPSPGRSCCHTHTRSLRRHHLTYPSFLSQPSPEPARHIRLDLQHRLLCYGNLANVRFSRRIGSYGEVLCCGNCQMAPWE